jgi:hypothetical protein
MKTKLSDFNVTLSDLKQMNRNDEKIMQNHFGDFLMIEEVSKTASYRVWLNHPENVKQGEPAYQIEYCGSKNNYVWETIGQGNE